MGVSSRNIRSIDSDYSSYTAKHAEEGNCPHQGPVFPTMDIYIYIYMYRVLIY